MLWTITDHLKAALKCCGLSLTTKATLKCCGLSLTTKATLKCCGLSLTTKTTLKCCGLSLTTKAALKCIKIYVFINLFALCQRAGYESCATEMSIIIVLRPTARYCQISTGRSGCLFFTPHLPSAVRKHFRIRNRHQLQSQSVSNTYSCNLVEPLLDNVCLVLTANSRVGSSHERRARLGGRGYGSLGGGVCTLARVRIVGEAQVPLVRLTVTSRG